MEETRVVTIHQPNFAPWLGFFSKMASADVFILLDNVPFSKNSFQNRVTIKSAQGEQWLTVPVLTKGRSGQLTSEVPISTNSHWQRKHLATLRTNYQPAPYYEQVMAWLEPLYENTPSHLTPFNIALIEAIRRQLGLVNECELASAVGVQGSGPELLLRLVQATEGNVYLSGPSGRDYLDMSIFDQAGVEVQFHDFQHPVYPQLYDGFSPGLSIIDLLMNVGSSAAKTYLENDSIAFQNGFHEKTEAAQTM
jgi:hypothetical protein